MFGQLYILPIVTEFLDIYPEVTGRLVFLDRVTNLIDEGLDVAIRIGHLPDSSYSAIKVGSVRRVVCGAPEYFDREGVPARPANLATHRIIAATSAWTSLDWRFGREEKETVRVSSGLFCNSNPAAIEAARSGWGLTRVLSYQVGPDLVSGELQTVLEEYEEEPLPVHIVHPEGRNASAKVRTFVDFAAERLRANRFSVSFIGIISFAEDRLSRKSDDPICISDPASGARYGVRNEIENNLNGPRRHCRLNRSAGAGQ